MRKASIRIFAFLLCALLFAVSASASASALTTGRSRLYDDAELLNKGETSALKAKLDAISDELKFDIVIVTVDELPAGYYKVRNFADDIYDRNGYRIDGCLLLICMEERDWYISTSGYGITAFTDAGIKHIGDEIKEAGLSDGDYAAAFDRFSELCREFVLQARSGEPYDNHNLPVDTWDDVIKPALIVGVIVGVIIAFVLAGVLRSNMKTVNAKADANTYVCRDSVDIQRRHDIYLYSHVTRTPRPKSSSSGSSTHRGSSGRSHGGGGGRF